MNDKNSDLNKKYINLLMQNIQNLIFEDNTNDLDKTKTKIENEVKKSFTEINYNYNLSKNLPERDEQKYLRIEKYEDYEFTHCIAYEMATRNSEVIKLTNIVENLNNLCYYIYIIVYQLLKQWKQL